MSNLLLDESACVDPTGAFEIFLKDFPLSCRNNRWEGGEVRMEKKKIDYLIEFLNALANLKNSDGRTPSWANTLAGQICDEIVEELKKL